MQSQKSFVKTCPICKKTKSIDSFYMCYSKPRGKYRPSSYCKDCSKTKCRRRAKEHYRLNKESKKQYQKKYRRENKEKIELKRGCYKKRQIEELQDCYVSDLLVQRHGFDRDAIRLNPELIEIHRNQIKIKRIIKSWQKTN